MSTYHFQEVCAQRHYSAACPVCGKKTTRSKRFTMTINPFNRNEDGTVKTYDQVRGDVNAEADRWEPDFTHQKCVKETR